MKRISAKLIVTDLDNTLLRTDKTISNYTLKIFERCHKFGIYVAFITSRPMSMVVRYTEMMHVDAVAVNTGAEIYVNNKLLIDYLLPNSVVNPILAELAINPSVNQLNARTKQGYYTTNKLNKDPSKILWDFSQPICEAIIHFSFSTIDDSLIQSLLKRQPTFSFHIFNDSGFCDVGSQEATKLNAVSTIARHFNTSISETIAFGDDLNDVEMLNVCAIGVAVANAQDNVKRSAGYICESCDNDGVAHWIEEHILNVSMREI